MSEEMPRITEDAVRELATAQSFERGVDYYEGGAIFDTVRQGKTLRACCYGSSYEPYQVSATVDLRGLVNLYCTCPYDWGGICKHLVALALTWIHEPDSFRVLVPVEEVLADYTREQLILLIQEMLQREPGLRRLLELPMQPDSGASLDVEAFRRQIEHVLKHASLNPDRIANELEAIFTTADRFREAEDWEGAGALYHLVLARIVPIYEGLYDEEGAVAIQLQRCAGGLGECLDVGSPDPELRRAWLEALLEAELKDLEMGGRGLAYPAGDVVIEQATDKDWNWIEVRVREEIAALPAAHSDWHREALGGFLISWLQMQQRESEVDALVFELGTPRQQAFLLVQRGDYERAIEMAQTHFSHLPGLVHNFADALVQAGASARAVAYVSSLIETRSRKSYLTWLAEHAEAQGNLRTALDWWQELFRASPDLSTYQSLQRVAESLDVWNQLHSQLLQSLEGQEQWSLLLQIALEEGDVARALELLPRLGGKWYSGRYDLQVAEAAERDYPQEALKIYLQRVEGLIGARGRDNYRTAAELLIRVRELYHSHDASRTWQDYIADLRDRHGRLPALQDELNKAGL